MASVIVKWKKKTPHVECLAALLEYGAMIDYQSNGKTALYFAVEHKASERLSTLTALQL